MKFTKEQALAITGYTGICAINFGTFQKDVEKRLGQPVWTHQFGNKDFKELVADLYRNDFLKMCG